MLTKEKPGVAGSKSLTARHYNPNFDAIKTACLADAARLVTNWLPDGKREGSEYTTINPTRADNRPGSFKINLDTGQWADFATGDKGGDLIGLYAYLNRLSQGDAARELAGITGTTQASPPDNSHKPKSARKWNPITPIPNAAPPAPAAHPRHGKPSSTWTYRDATGQALCNVCRFDTAPDTKQFASLSFCRNEDGNTAWRWQALPAPRPLYNLHLLAARPDAVVAICEGEKAADAAAILLPDMVTSTSPNGSNSPDKADWMPLAGRDCVIWPDKDEPGRTYAETVTRLLMEAGAASVRVVNLAAFGHDLAEGWDAANALQEGWTAERVTELRQSPNFFIAPQEPEILELEPDDSETASLEKDAPHFEVRDAYQSGIKNGLYWFDGEGSVWVSDPLYITAQACDETGHSWGKLLEFFDPAGNIHRWAMPLRLLAGDGSEMRAELLDSGLSIAPGRKARELLTQYVQTARPEEFARSVEKTGWHRGAFILPGEQIGGPVNERIVLQTAKSGFATYTEAGSLKGWQQHVAALCRGNSRLTFAVSTAFAAPLLELTSDESGGFHFRGASSGGKTTTLRAARSVYGPPDFLCTWRATTNGLESIAAARNDSLLLLDELGQLDPREAGDTAYLLANGHGKQRADRYGLARPRQTWRLLFLSTGELSLADKLNEAGRRARAGQETRLADIPADTGKYGAFENLHGYESGADFADAVRRAADSHYGTAARAFLRTLVAQNREVVQRDIRELITNFVKGYVPQEASGQVARVARRFALVAAGGELATAYGVTGWTKGAATQGVASCFRAWLSTRGGIGNLENRAALAQLRLFFEQHGDSRFTPWRCEECHGIGTTTLANGDEVPCRLCDGSGHPTRPTINRAGFRRDTEEGQEFYVFPEVFRQEICKGLDPKHVVTLLVERDLVYTDSDGKKAVTSPRLPGIGTKRVYHLKPAILRGE